MSRKTWDDPLSSLDACREAAKKLVWTSRHPRPGDVGVGRGRRYVQSRGKASLDPKHGPFFVAVSRMRVVHPAGTSPGIYAVPVVRWSVRAWVHDGARVVGATVRGADSRWAAAFAALVALVQIRHPWRY